MTCLLLCPLAPIFYMLHHPKTYIATLRNLLDNRTNFPHVAPYIDGHGLVGRDGRVKRGPERPQLHHGHERRAVAGVHETHRRPARPRDEHRLVHRVAVDIYGVPVVHPQVHVELQRQAVLAVVVAVQELKPEQVLRPTVGGQRVAVPYAGREAPERMEIPRAALLLGGHLVVLPIVDVRIVGDVEDAGVAVRVVAVVGVQAAVDAQKA